MENYVEKTGLRVYVIYMVVVIMLSLLIAMVHNDSFRVKRVIDGDTFILRGGSVVRLIGVNTPEIGEKGMMKQDFG